MFICCIIFYLKFEYHLALLGYLHLLIVFLKDIMRISNQILTLWHAYHIQLQTLTESCNLICTAHTLYNTHMIFILNRAHPSITSPLEEKLWEKACLSYQRKTILGQNFKCENTARKINLKVSVDTYLRINFQTGHYLQS